MFSHSAIPPPLAHLIRRKRPRPSVANDFQRTKMYFLTSDLQPHASTFEFKTFPGLWSTQGRLHHVWKLERPVRDENWRALSFRWPCLGPTGTTREVHSYTTEPEWSCPPGSLLRAGPASTPLGFLATASEPSRPLTMALRMPTKCLAYASCSMGSSTQGQTQLLPQRSMTNKAQRQYWCLYGNQEQTRYWKFPHWENHL